MLLAQTRARNRSGHRGMTGGASRQPFERIRHVAHSSRSRGPTPRSSPNALPARILDLAFPRRLHQLHHIVGHGNVIELESHRLAVLVSPLEKLLLLFYLFAVRLSY